MKHEHQSRGPNPPKSNARWVLLGFLAIAGFFLLTEHRAHVLGFLPFLLLLACPLMHIFMHRGHGGHKGQSSERRNPERENAQ